MNVILYGPPGVGKGTQAVLLCQRRGYKHLSTGELLRAAIRSYTPLGQQIKDIVRAGRLVSDETVTELVRSEVRSSPPLTQFLFDGYPRTLIQVDHLDAILDESQVGSLIAFAIFLDQEEIVRRLSGRYQCRECGTVFNIYSKAPRREDTCDECGGVLARRADDVPEVIRERMRVYQELTSPVMEAYRSRGILHEIEGVGTPQEIHERILGKLESIEAAGG